MYRLLSLMCILVVFSYSAHADKSECIKHHCIAIIDAGSSGSRLHIYAYDLDESNTPVQIKEIWNRKALPGISTIEHEHRSVAVYLEKLFTDAPTVIMPVYFYSTAGMRLLPKNHHKTIYQMVEDWFDKQYYWRLISAQTINGNQEGIYAWLATNYQLKRFEQPDKPLVGVMDIGGASVQIVFPIKDTSLVNDKDKVTIDLYGRRHTLFSHSFLGLGQNEMGHQYFDLNTCYPNGFELPSGQAGEGNAQICKDEISILVNDVHSVRKTVYPVLSPNPVEQWYIIGGITYLLNDTLFPFNNQQFNNQELLQHADTNLCQQQWSTLEQTNPGNHMLFNYCMLTSYIYALTTNGYGLQPNQNINYMPLEKTVDWTIGVVLQHHQT